VRMVIETRRVHQTLPFDPGRVSAPPKLKQGLPTQPEPALCAPELQQPCSNNRLKECAG